MSGDHNMNQKSDSPDWDSYKQGWEDGVMAEREMCAKACDTEKSWWSGMSRAEEDIYQAIDNISALIRARGESK